MRVLVYAILVYLQISGQFISSEASAFAKNEIESAHVVLFVKSHCPYCRRAISILNSYVGSKLSERDLRIVDIAKRPDCHYIQDYLESITGARTVITPVF